MIEKLLVAFYSQNYNSKKEMSLAYSLYEKKWRRYARKNKLDEKQFETLSKQTLTKIKNDGNK